MIDVETFSLGPWKRSIASREGYPPPHRSVFDEGEHIRLWSIRETAGGPVTSVQDFDGCTAVVLQPVAHARNTDPETSHLAAKSVRVTRGRAAVLEAFRRAGPMTDEDAYPMVAKICSRSGARTRRAELVDLKLIRDSGRWARTAAGRRTIIWEAIR